MKPRAQSSRKSAARARPRDDDHESGTDAASSSGDDAGAQRKRTRGHPGERNGGTATNVLEGETAKLKKQVADLKAAAAQGQLEIEANAAAGNRYKNKKAKLAALHADT